MSQGRECFIHESRFCELLSVTQLEKNHEVHGYKFGGIIYEGVGDILNSALINTFLPIEL